jgi:hypothetical protein
MGDLQTLRPVNTKRQESRFDSKENIGGKLLLNGGCVKQMFLEARIEEIHFHLFAILETPLLILVCCYTFAACRLHRRKYGQVTPHCRYRQRQHGFDDLQ